MARGGHRRIGALGEQARDALHQRRIEQRLVALDIHDDLVVREVEQRSRLGETIGARRVVRARHDSVESMCDDGVEDPRIVGRDDDAPRTARPRLLGDPDDHRPPADVGERLRRQPRRRVAGGNEYREAHGHALNPSALPIPRA